MSDGARASAGEGGPAEKKGRGGCKVKVPVQLASIIRTRYHEECAGMDEVQLAEEDGTVADEVGGDPSLSNMVSSLEAQAVQELSNYMRVAAIRLGLLLE